MAIEDKDLEGLSEQERAALAEDTDDEATLRAIAEKKGPADDDTIAGGEGKGDSEDADDEDDDPAADDKGKKTADAAAEEDKDATKAAEAAAAAAAAAEKPKDGKEGGPTPAPLPEPVVFSANAPEDAAEQIKALRTEKAAEFKKLMDGEITPEQYSAKEDEILEKITEIDRDVTTAKVAADFTVQQAQRSYIGKVNATLDRAKSDDGIDYRAAENKHLHEALDRTVKWLANDPSNADKPEQWFLDEAHAMVKARHGLGKAATPAAAAPAAAAPASRSGKGPDLNGLPPTVRNVPAASGAEDGGEFAHLNNLTGMALERAVARMTPEQQQRWAEAD